MSHTYTNLLYHFVWSTKERRPFIDDKLEAELHKYLGGTIRDLGGTALLVGGMPDHVHILAVLPARRALSDLLRDVKANSSGWVHEKFPALREFAWQTGYGAFTVSQSQKANVLDYIARQKEHHRVKTFQEEFVELLERHEIEYEPKYLWE